MTTINQLREIADRTRDMPNKRMKISYLNDQSREVLNFLASNIQKDGVGKAIAENILKSDTSISTMEGVVAAFKHASEMAGKLDKATEIRRVCLTPQDRDFVLECLYGSLKLGITVPTPTPLFGDTFKPQLCGTGVDFDPTEYMIEEKFDGIRCIGMNVDGKIRLHTRNGKPIISETVKKELKDAIPPGYVLDGELVATSGDFQDLKRHGDELVYRVFDIPFHMNNNIAGLPLHSRRDVLEETLHSTDHIQLSPILPLSTMRDINKWIERNDVEGCVVKDPKSFYTYGGRKDWIKIKPWMDVTCRVTGFTQGTGKRDRDDMIGAIEVIPEGSQVKTLVGTGFSDSDLIQMKKLLREEKNITVDIKFQNLTNDGCLRFPVFLRIREVT